MYGLLQTREYARAVIEGSFQPIPTTAADALVEVKMKRKETLIRQDGRQLHVVLDESVLHRIVGSPEIMQAQLRHLVEMAQRPNVRLQVLPFDSGTVASNFTGPVVLNKFPHTKKGPVVYLENAFKIGSEHPGEGVPKGSFVGRPADVRKHNRAYEYACAQALSPDQSIDRIKSLVSRAR